MYRFLSLLLFIGLAWGQNRCEDPKYISLKNKGVDNLTDGEFDYYFEIFAECKSYDKSKIKSNPSEKHIDIKAHNREMMKKYGMTDNWSKIQYNKHKPKTVTPCNDRKFLELKSKSLDDLTEEEYEYFMLKEKKCSEWRISKNTNEVVDKPKYVPNNNNTFWLDVGNELINIIDDHQNNPVDIFSPKNNTLNSSSSTPVCQYDNQNLKSTFDTKFEEGKSWRKYTCTFNKHSYWLPD